MATNKRLFHALHQQLSHEIMFVDNVGAPYLDTANELDIIEFKYRGMPCKLVLNGKVLLETERGEIHVQGYRDLVQGLIQSTLSRAG